MNTTKLLNLLETNPKAYVRTVRRLHTKEPETFEVYARAVQRGYNRNPDATRKWTLAGVRSFLLGAS